MSPSVAPAASWWVDARLDDRVDLDRGAKLYEPDAGRLVLPLYHHPDVPGQALGALEAVLGNVHVVSAFAVQDLQEGTHIGQLPSGDGDAGDEAPGSRAADLEGDRAVRGPLVVHAPAARAVPPTLGPALDEHNVVEVILGGMPTRLADVCGDDFVRESRWCRTRTG